MDQQRFKDDGVSGHPLAERRNRLTFRALLGAFIFLASPHARAAEPPVALAAPANSHRQPNDPPSLVGPLEAPGTGRSEAPAGEPARGALGDRESGSADAAEVSMPTALPSSSASPVTLSDAQVRDSFRWLAELALHQLPRTHTGDSGWGETKKLWAGVKIDRDGWKLKTHRRFRELRHGRWSRYTLTLPPGDRPERLAIHVRSVERDAQGRWRVESTITAPMTFQVRLERWNLGVQWYSISVTGDLRVKLHSTATIGFLADYSEVPPTLCIEPHMEQAEVVLERFEVDRISKVGGDAAEEMGEVMEGLIRKLWLEEQNERLSDKLNRSIERHQDDLRWSLADWFSDDA